MRIGLDIDGVFADFNESFIQRVVDVTGKDLFPSEPFDIPTWNYPEHYGYTEVDVMTVWADIKKDTAFWACLPAYAWTEEALYRLDPDNDDLYFITSRPGIRAKAQTELWLADRADHLDCPTVLISSNKGACCKALGIEVYIDDRDVNVFDVRSQSPETQTFLLDQPWNQGVGIYDWKGIVRVKSPMEMLSAIGR